MRYVAAGRRNVGIECTTSPVYAWEHVRNVIERIKGHQAMRQLITYAGWFSILLNVIGLIGMLRQPVPAPHLRHVYRGQRIGAGAGILLGLALAQITTITWFAWLCLSLGIVLSIMAVVIWLRRRRQS